MPVTIYLELRTNTIVDTVDATHPTPRQASCSHDFNIATLAQYCTPREKESGTDEDRKAAIQDAFNEYNDNHTPKLKPYFHRVDPDTGKWDPEGMGTNNIVGVVCDENVSHYTLTAQSNACTVLVKFFILAIVP